VGFVIAIVAILGVAAIATTWYARGSYFVGLSGDNVTIFRGRPGGFLWVKPTLVSRTSLTVDEVPPSRRAHLREGQPEPTIGAARHYIDNLRDEAAKLALTTTTTAPAPADSTTAVPPTVAP
jgi:PPM family protein phosphatase